MHIINVEFKARVADTGQLENKLLSLHPVFKGTDRQIDTYFNALTGRLKLREGNIENALIQYERGNTAEAKQSAIILYQHQPSGALKDILTAQLGVKVIVDKIRKIYFIENVKFHFDQVEELGSFVEVEAIDADNKFSVEELKGQCDRYFDFFGLDTGDLVDKSYSDMLLSLKSLS